MNKLRKIIPHFSFHYVAYTLMFFVVVFSVVHLVSATTPNPGHPWIEVGDGNIIFADPGAGPFTYTLPSANTTILTTNALVTVGQGGTGANTFASNGVLYGNGSGAIQALAVNAGATQCLTQASSAAPAWGSCGSSYTFSTGLTNSSGTITANLSTGVSGGQSAIGGTAAGNNLTLSSTTNGTKGKIIFGSLSAYDEVNDRFGIGQTSPSARLDIKTDSLGTTQTASSGISLVNTTAAAAGAQQISPAVIWTGQGWKTNATAASQSVAFRSYVLPAQGAANPTGAWLLESSINGAAYVTRMSVGTSDAADLIKIGDVAGGTNLVSISSTGVTLNGSGGVSLNAPNVIFTSNGSDERLNFNTSAGTYGIGDLSVADNGSVFYLDDTGSIAYYDKTSHNGSFGINTSTPAAALDVVGNAQITTQSATAFTVARLGTNYALQVDTNTASSATGLKVTSAAAGGGLALSTISTGTDESITIDAKGAGTVGIGGTSTGNILLGGGSGSTGCTVTNSNGNFACTGTGTFSNFSGTNTGDVTLGSFGSSPNANGASLSGQALTLQPADGSNPGGVSTTTQTFGGNKTFSGNTAFTGSQSTTLQSTTALTVARSGTDYAFQVDTNTASSVTGLKITSAAANTGLALSVISTSANEALAVDAKGSGNITIGSSSTGSVFLAGGQTSTGCSILNSTGAILCSGGGTFGLNGGSSGSISLLGSTSGTISINSQATAGTYNFNLPTTAGSSSQVLTSAGGGASPMTWTTLDSIATTGLTNGSGTTASGTAVNLGGSTTTSTLIEIGGDSFEISSSSKPAGLFIDGNSYITQIGDVNLVTGSNIFTVDDANSFAYYDNIGHNGKFGINTVTPATELDVVGTLQVSTLATGGSNECVQVGSTGILSKTGSACGSGGGLTVGTTTISSGTASRVLFEGAGNVLAEDADFTFSTDTLTVTKIAATTFTGNITTSAVNIITDTTTGTKIGTSTLQKLGFFNATPVVQQTGNVLTALQNLGLVASATLPASSVSSGAALTKTDDTNVTLTLGGSPSTALLAASSLTLGWTGQLSVARGGTNCSAASITCFNNITGYTAAGATGTTSTNLVFSTSPTITTPTFNTSATLAAGANLVFTSGAGQIQQTFTTASAVDASAFSYTLTNSGAGVSIGGLALTPVNNTNPSSGTNTLNVINFAAGTNGNDADNTTNGINFASATGYKNFLNSPSIVINSSGAITGATGFNGLVVTANTGAITTGTWTATAVGSQYGGTGQNFSGSTGVPSISSGTWSVNAQLPVSLGGTNCSAASITCFNNITGFTASGATGTTSTNLVFSTSPALTTPTVVTSIVGGASFDAFNTVSTTLNIGGAATTFALGGTPTSAVTANIFTNATASATTKTLNIGTGGAAGSTTNINIGSSNGGTTTINSPTTALGTGSITMTGSLGTTGARLTKGWFTDLEVTNAIVGSITGSAPTLTTSRNLWGQSFNGSADVTGSLTSVGDITGGASSMVITAGTGNSRTLTLRSTTAGGTATAFLTGNADQSSTFGGNISGTGSWTLTGGAGNMTIVAGTGNSRTMALQTTTAGGTATTFLTGNADQSATFANVVTAGNFTVNSTTVPVEGMYRPTGAGNLGFSVSSAAELLLTSTAFSPAADGGNSLGTTALGWQNLFGNTGFVLNIENGDWVATHTAGILTVGTGDLRVTNAGTNSASVVTIAGTQTLTNKTLTSPNINEAVALTSTSTKLNYLTSATGTTGTASTNVVFSGSPTIATPTITTSATVPLLIGSTSANGTLTLEGNNTTGNTATNANLIFKVGDSAGTTAMTILNNGKVGIGDATPADLFTVGSGDLFQIDSSGNTSLFGGADLRYVETGGGTDFVAFQAPSSITSSITWTLPSADSSGTQCLKSNGSGTLSFGSCGAGGSSTWDAITDPAGNQTLSFGTNTSSWTSTLTTGSFFSVTDSSFNPGAGNTGTLFNYSITNAGTNTSGASTVNGINIASTVNTSGATGTKLTNAINVASPTLTGCTGGACTWYGLNITAPATASNINSTAINITASNFSKDNTAATGVTSAVAGIFEDLTFTDSAGKTQIGNRMVISNAPTSLANTSIAQVIRTTDNTSLANTVRGIEIVSSVGSNTSGTNTGLRATGATFGVQGITTGNAGGVSAPAALYGEMQGTTQGDALRLYSTTITSSPAMATFYQDTSVFSGAGILMDFGSATSDTFTGKFLDLKNDDDTKFYVDANGKISLTLDGTASTAAICGSQGTGTSGDQADIVLRDCSGAPAADYAEMYPVSLDTEYGDIVMTGTDMVNTYDTTNGNIDWNKIKGKITKLVKSNAYYQNNVIGIVVDNHGDFTSSGYNLKESDNPMPVALNGRVPVKISSNSPDIMPGDYLTTSTDPGKATKATRAGAVIGKALGVWTRASGDKTVMVYVEQGFYNGQGVSQFAGIDPMSSDFSKLALKKFMQSTNDMYLNSEVLAGRISAGLEVITPKLVADNVSTNTINSSTGENIGLVISGTGKFVIGANKTTNPDGTSTVSNPVITFDNLGNAVFAGKITAKEIQVGDLSGIQDITNQINQLAQGQQAFNLTAQAMNALSGALTVAQSDIENIKGKINNINQKVDGLTILGSELDNRLKSIEAIFTSNTFNNILSLSTTALAVGGDAQFNGNSVFNGGVEFGNQTEFSVPPLFNKNSAGYAIVKEGDRRVRVAFDQAYIATPVVNTSITFESNDNIDDSTAGQLFASDIRFIIVSKDQTGFTILLNKNAPRDVRFSWNALAVKDPQIFESVFEGLTIEQPQTVTDNNTNNTDTTPTGDNNGETDQNNTSENQDNETTDSGSSSTGNSTTPENNTTPSDGTATSGNTTQV